MWYLYVKSRRDFPKPKMQKASLRLGYLKKKGISPMCSYALKAWPWGKNTKNISDRKQQRRKKPC
jgi:hypothetical protein